MSMHTSGGATIDPATMRGRDWPCLRQFVVLLENRVGSLHQLLRQLEGHSLKVMAISITNAVDAAIVRLVVDNYERGREVLDLSKFKVFETDLIGVELPDHPQPYVSICLALLQAELNIHYTYPLLYRRSGHGAIGIYVDDIDLGIRTLSESGHQLITEKDLQEDEGYF